MSTLYQSDGTTVQVAAFARTLSNGQRLLVSVIAPAGWVRATVDGQVVYERLGLAPLPEPVVVHGTAYAWRAGKYVVTDAEAQMVEDARSRAEAEYNATPDGIRRAEHQTRVEARYAREADEIRRERAWEREDEETWARERR